MIEYREDPEGCVFEIVVDGKIEAGDYHEVVEKALAFMDAHENVRVLKEIRNLSGLDVAILKEKLIAELFKNKDKITHAALVSDKMWIEQLTRLIRPLFPCQTRIFACEDIEEARQWIRTAPDRQPTIEVMPETDGNLLCLRAVEKLSHVDYEKVLIPRLEAIIKEHGRARLLVDFGEVFYGIEMAAMWDDTKFGLKHKFDFEKMAIVGGPRWSDWAGKLAAVWMSCEVQTFPPYRLGEALDWIKTPVRAKR